VDEPLAGAAAAGPSSAGARHVAWSSTPDFLTAPLSSRPPAGPDAAALDAALTLALDQSQDQLEALHKESDAYRHKAMKHEAEVARLSVLLERNEAERSRLMQEQRREMEERRKEGEELQQLRREHREALGEAAGDRAKLHELRAISEEQRWRLEELVQEQRERLQLMEEVGGHTTNVSDALYRCVSERASMLHFLAELLLAQHTLLYHRPKDLVSTSLKGFGPSDGASARKSSSPSRARGRSQDRLSGTCAACVSESQVPRCRTCLGRREVGHEALGAGTGATGGPTVSSDLRELAASLEGELANGAQNLQAQAQRVAVEAEITARALATRPSGADAYEQERSEVSVAQHACSAWLEQERLQRERVGLPPRGLVPRISWAEERAHYQATMRVAESKFAQLAKVRRVLKNRQAASKRRTSRG